MQKDIEPKISEVLDQLIDDVETRDSYFKGLSQYESGGVQMLSRGDLFFEISVEDKFKDFKVSFDFDEKLAGDCSCKSKTWCSHRIAALMQVDEIIDHPINKLPDEGKTYSREGMIKRVLKERMLKAKKAAYTIRYSDNKYGEHLLINEKDMRYKITFRDFEKEEGYCSCHDYQNNKLGTCKHLMFAFDDYKKRYKRKPVDQDYPFVEVYTDPIHEYRISLFYPDTLPAEIKPLIDKFFGNVGFIAPGNERRFLGFIKEAQDYKQILIRPEVLDKVEAAFDKEVIEQKRQTATLDFSRIKADLYPYQKEGITFATFRKGAVIADEMGLGKTLQAIGTAIFKKDIFDFKKTLIICPASLKSQWKTEIEKFSDEKAVIAEGFPDERAKIYQQNGAYFTIINYETVLRDGLEIDKAGFDFIILDEAQRIKNFETLTANAIKRLKRNHSLVITGTPIENKLVDLYSIIGFVDPKLLAPLWEFSYQHCYFSKSSQDKITGYFNLQQLKEKLSSVLIRREKKDVIDQLNKVHEKNIFVEMHPQQQDYHGSFARGVASILAKKFKTPYDMQKLNLLLQNMRMVCNSTFLIDKETHFSPKLVALEEILLEQLDLKNNQRKILIFSEWTTMNQIIGKLLSKNNIGYTELSGKVPVKKRQALIEEFEANPKCQVFLSTEAGGAGLNLQVADTVINFELPWNPAKKNQRIGRVDRLGQKNKNLTVINLLTENSIEINIASGIGVKQNLFDNVLNEGETADMVDFSSKGRAQFLQELEGAMQEFSEPQVQEKNIPEKEFVQQELNFEETAEEKQIAKAQTRERIQKMEEMETVMNKGLEFLSGLFKMSTGKELTSSKNKVEIDRETGEVIMRFKVDF